MYASNVKKTLILAAIAGYFGLALSWSWPYTWQAKSRLNALIAPAMTYAGLWQNWGMFSGPRKFNLRHEVEVELKDGSIHVWKAPLMHELSLVGRFGSERYRKWSQDNGLKAPEKVWKEALPAIVRSFANDSSNPPVYAQVVRYTRKIPEPGAAEAPSELDEGIYEEEL